jgi:protease PrsW
LPASGSPAFFALCGLALLPGLLWLWYFWARDEFEPEPLALVARLFLAGAGAFVFAWGLEQLAQSALEGAGIKALVHPLGYAALWAYGVIAPIEEVLKALVVLLFAYPNAEFDEPMDGVVYASSAALGFATVENISYVLAFDGATLVIRAGFCCFLHAGCSGLVGYYLGRAKFAPAHLRIGTAIRGLVLAWFLHGTYDFFVFSGWYAALFLIVVLLWGVKLFLDQGISDALRRSPFRPPPTRE